MCELGNRSESIQILTTTAGYLIGDIHSPTPKGFEPLRAEPNGFLVHLLNHSDTVSWDCGRS